MESKITENVSYEDFKNIYKVFGEIPYEEKYTEEDFREIYREYMEKGKIYGAYVDGILRGIIAITYGAKKNQPISFNDKKVLYLSDVAVDKEYRKKGLGTKLMAYVIASGKLEGNNIIYMRTLKEGSMSASIARKLGFKKIPDVEQDVTTESIYGTSQTKKNIFLSMDLDMLSREDLSSILGLARDAKADPKKESFMKKYQRGRKYKMNAKDYLEKLVSFNTIKDKENSKIIDYIENCLNSNGFKTIVKDKILIMTNGKEDLTDSKIGFVGHTDTVDFNNWDYDPFKLTKVGSRLIGLGSCDMKGGIACIMEAISKVDFKALKKKMMVCFTYDEEIGFSGIKDVLKLNLKLPERLIIGEPTNNEMYLGSKGLLEYKVSFFGKSSHSSMPFKGKNAILDMMKFISELNSFYESDIKSDLDNSFDVPYSTFNVGIVKGGTAINIVPDYAKVKFDFRTINKNENRIKEYVDNLCIKYRAEKEIINEIAAFKCKSKFLKSIKTSPFITEASFLKGERIILGPGPINAHEKNEYVEISSLEKCVKQYIDLIKKS